MLAGRPYGFWRGLLRERDLGLGLAALARAREAGPESFAWMLEDRPHLPEWPCIWATEGCAPEQALSPCDSYASLTLVRVLRRWRTRSAPRRLLERCRQGVLSSDHPLVRLCWVLLLLEHPDHVAERELLRLISTPRPRQQHWYELAELSAWALARLGRAVLPGVLQLLESAPPAIATYLIQTLYYLGPLAHGCQTALRPIQGEWVEAVLRRLEGTGAADLIERRCARIWLDLSSLSSLQQLAFSVQPADRLYAARALNGWGPALEQARPLLEQLALDEVPEIREAAWDGLAELGGVQSPRALQMGLESQRLEIRVQAARQLEALAGERVIRLLENPRWGLLARLALAWSEASVQDLEEEAMPQQACLRAAWLRSLRTQQPPRRKAEALTACLSHEDADVRRAAFELAVAWRCDAQVARALADPELHEEALLEILRRPTLVGMQGLLDDHPQLERHLLGLLAGPALSQSTTGGIRPEWLARIRLRLQELGDRGDSIGELALRIEAREFSDRSLAQAGWERQSCAPGLRNGRAEDWLNQLDGG